MATDGRPTKHKNQKNGKSDSPLTTAALWVDAIKLAREVDDQGTVDLFTMILKMEEGHEEWAEMQREQIKQMGLENYLSNQG